MRAPRITGHTVSGGDLHVSQGSASILVTVGQLGYAVGLLFIVPAGDIMRRRPLLTGMLAFCAITLAGAAAAPSLPVLDAAVALCCVPPWLSRCWSRTRRRWPATTSAAG